MNIACFRPVTFATAWSRSHRMKLCSGALFQYRFHAGRGLRGHSFGNLFLTALSHVTGDFSEAVRVSGEVLAIRGRIFPTTLENVSLEAVMADGKIVSGETRIAKCGKKIRRLQIASSPCSPVAGSAGGHPQGGSHFDRAWFSLHQHPAQSACFRRGRSD